MMTDVFIARILGIAFAGILGSVLGSFINVLALRWHSSATLMGRSACPSCKTVLKPRHLVPILSWLWLRGRCAECRRPIHIQYPLVEAAAAFFGIVAALRWDPFFAGTGLHFWFDFIVSLGILVPLVMDIRWKEVPVEYVIGLSVVAAVLRGWLLWSSGMVLTNIIVNAVIAISVAVIFFGGQVVISRERWLGQGDVWFGLFMAAALGWPGLGIAVYVAYIIGGGFAAVGLATGSVKRGTRIPFVPALATGFLIALWYGEWILGAVRTFFP